MEYWDDAVGEIIDFLSCVEIVFSLLRSVIGEKINWSCAAEYSIVCVGEFTYLLCFVCDFL